jgi:hypothetical protein
MTKTTIILAFSIVLALVIGIVSSGPVVEAVKPITEAIIVNDSSNPIPVTGIPSNVVCPVGDSKMITTYDVRPGIDIQHATEPTIEDGGQVLISTIHDIDEVIDARGPDVVNRLNELGYFVDDGSVRDVNSGDINNAFFEDMIPFCMES